MWKINKVKAENFMSFEKVEIDLSYGCTVVKAENYDDDGQESNGGGKSSFIDIIPVAILGQSLTGRNLKECINWNGEDNFFTVEIEMEHPTEGNCIISRKVYSNTRNAELHILKNGKIPPDTTGKGDTVDVNEGNKYILNNILDISKEDLLNYYFISGNYYTSYFKASAPKKVEIINRFSKANSIDPVIEGLAQLEKKNEEMIIHFDQSREIINDSINNKTEKIKELEVIQNDGVGDSGVKEYEDKEQAIIELKDILVNLDTSDVDKAEKELKDTRETSHKITKERNDVLKMLGEIEVKVSGMITCPKCNYEFTLGGENVAELQKMQKELKEIADILTSDELSSEEDIRKVATKVREAQSKIEESKRIVSQQINQYTQEIKEAAAHYDQYKLQVEQIQGLKRSIEADQLQIRENEKNMKETEKENENVRVWRGRFEDFKFYLANKPIKIICAYINTYLQENKSNMVMTIEGFKQLKSGEMRQKLNPIIYRGGEEGKEYNVFSGGEKVRLNISADLAFQELINTGSRYGGLNFYCNDELLNSLDGLGIKNAAEAFDSLEKTILLVSHSGADLNYNKVYNIVKENGVSNLK